MEVQVSRAHAHLAIGTMPGMMARIMHRLTNDFAGQLVAEVDDEFIARIEAQRRRLQPAVAPVTVADQTVSVLGDTEVKGELQPAVLAVQFGRLLNKGTRGRARTSVVARAPRPRLPDHHRNTRQQQDGQPEPVAHLRFRIPLWTTWENRFHCFPFWNSSGCGAPSP